MQPKKLLILGGYGNAGFPLTKLLLQYTDLHLVLAGRTPDRAKEAALKLNEEFGGVRVSGIPLDAGDAAALKQVFSGIDMVVVASSTAQFAKTVATAALDAGIDYLDIQLSGEEKLRVLKSLQKEMEKKGCCFITDGGFHPGLPAVMVRHAAQQFEKLYKANVGSMFSINWGELNFSPETIREFSGEITSEIANPRPAIYRDGQWRKAGMFSSRDYPNFDFGKPFGKRYCAPNFMEEMRLLPERFPSLQETGFYVSGFNWFVNGFVFPLLIIAAKIHPKGKHKSLNTLMDWGLRTFSKPPYSTILKLEAAGEKEGKPCEMEMIISHEDAYFLTAAPVAACLLQYLAGSARKPGLWLMAHLVEPLRLWEDMKKMGININIHILKEQCQT